MDAWNRQVDEALVTNRRHEILHLGRVVVERGEKQVRGERLVERRDERVHVLDAAAPTRRLGRTSLGRTGAVPSLRLGPLRVRGEVAEIGRPRVERGVLAVVLPVGLVRHLDVERVVPHGAVSAVPALSTERVATFLRPPPKKLICCSVLIRFGFDCFDLGSLLVVCGTEVGTFDRVVLARRHKRVHREVFHAANLFVNPQP